MRGGIAYERLDAIQPYVDLLEGIGTAGAELRDSTRKACANDVERGRYGPYRTGGLRPLFLKESCCKVDTRLLEYGQGN